jgi:hypothetical protein
MKRSIKHIQKFIFWLKYIEDITTPEYNDFLNPVGMLIFLSSPDIGFLDLMWSRELVFVKVRTLPRSS